MSKKRRENLANDKTVEVVIADSIKTSAEQSGHFGKVYAYVRQRLWIIPVVLVLVVGAVGGVLKHLEEDAVAQNRLPVNKRSALSSINPFVAMPSPTPTPQLSKEYIYAGSRLLAVEDANANAAPPADLAVWRPSTGYWYVLGGPGSQQWIQVWGSSGDIPVQGDYDGDGKTDFSVFRPGSNEWWIYKSSTETSYSLTFGSSGDIPVPGDYDGDGKTDAAIYRPSNGTWYITQSSDSSVIYQQFGLSTDVPAPADFDGDGKADLALWRESNKTYYSMNSSNNVLQAPVFTFTIIGTPVPVPADYDGDGKANYAVRNNDSWVILNAAATSFDTEAWQLASDIPVPNDYDGDGIVDIAVWRPVNSPGNTDVGTWFIRQSSKTGISGQSPSSGNPHPNEPRSEVWGTSGDIPVPAYFRR